MALSLEKVVVSSGLCHLCYTLCVVKPVSKPHLVLKIILQLALFIFKLLFQKRIGDGGW